MNAFAKRALFSYGSVTQTKADTADSHELVKLLFQGLTDRIAAARNALERGERMERADCVTRAQKILFGLRQTLDFEQGGELARNLDSLYDYCTRRLTEGHAREDDTVFQEVHELMVQIRDAWNVMPVKGPSLVQ
ncbi:MAG: flagellar export chaperone FliS [Pseudohongiellaceae bacterium]|jgi:flagellar secretion chaperone FliS